MLRFLYMGAFLLHKYFLFEFFEGGGSFSTTLHPHPTYS
jgi:hypothetical protein